MIDKSETNAKAMGGSELQAKWLEENVDPGLLESFQIILSRFTSIDPSKRRVLWCHDTDNDPMYNHLKDGGWNKFHRIVFVSHWQQQRFIDRFQIPWSRTAVLQNAITPIDDGGEQYKNIDTIKLIYHTTPHRGLSILVPVFKKLAEKHKNIHLDVWSSFGIYGWAERDVQFKELFDQIESHENMTLHPTASNDTIRDELKKSHIFAYPSIWPETSCQSLMEAMSAGCLCVHPSYAVLPETAANWTMMYNFNEDINNHASLFYGMLDLAIQTFQQEINTAFFNKIMSQKSYTDLFYSWELRKYQWEAFLRSFVNEPLEIPNPSAGLFTYRT